MLDARRALYGDRHPEVAQALIRLAMPMDFTAAPAEADVLMEEAVEILRATYPQGHPDLASTLRGQSMVLQRQHRDLEAEAPLREALAMTQRTVGEDALNSATFGLDLAHLVNINGGYEEAESLAREALRILHLHFDDGSAITARARVHLGDALRGQGRLLEAEPLLMVAWERLENTRIEWRFYAVGALARYYDAVGRPEEAARFRALLPPGP